MPDLRRYRNRARRFRQQPRAVKVAIIETVLVLAITRLAIKTVPFTWFVRILGTRFTESPIELTEAELAHVRIVARAVRLVSPHTVWTSNCLPQATTAKLLLRRRGVPSTLSIGAALRPNPTSPDGAKELHAHAWLRAGPIYLTGGNGTKDFGAVITYT